MQKIVCYIIVLIVSVGVFSGYAAAADVQFWDTESIEGKIGKGVKLKIEEEFRFSNDKNGFFYNHTDAGVSFNVFDWLTLGGNYRQIFERSNSASEWKSEERPHINMMLQHKWNGFVIKDRSRLEFRFRAGKDMGLRYRNKATVEFPVLMKRISLKPYVADEIFIDVKEVEFNRNRIYGGVKAKLTKNIHTEAFYMFQSSKKDDWQYAHVGGLKLKFV